MHALGLPLEPGVDSRDHCRELESSELRVREVLLVHGVDEVGKLLLPGFLAALKGSRDQGI